MSTQRLVKQISSADAAALVRDGARVMIGGFLNCGSPEKLIDEVLAASKQSLTVIANDTAFPKCKSTASPLEDASAILILIN